MATEVLQSLDLPVLFDDHAETFSTHTIPEATAMTCITLNIFDVTPLRAVAITTVLSLGFTPLAAQEIIVTPLDEQEVVVAPVSPQDSECLGFTTFDSGLRENFWEAVNLETVADCLNSGAEVNSRNEDGRTPLHMAASNENPEVLTLLLDAGADVDARNVDGVTPLFYAIGTSENPEIVNVLLDAGADANARTVGGMPPIAMALSSGINIDIFSAVLDAGADVNANMSFEGYTATPLHFMARYSTFLEPLTLLLDAGADVNARDENRVTPLHWAANKNPNLEVLKVLIDAGADVNARSPEGFTPFLSIIITENLEGIKVLIDAGADVNARSGYDYNSRESYTTGLHIAAQFSENPDIITTLLNAGADGTAVNGDGKTPFDLAKDNEALAGTEAYWALNDARFE